MIFIDTGAFLGRFLTRDQHHAESLPLWAKIERQRERCLTSNFVVDETLTFLARRSDYRYAAKKGRLIYGTAHWEIIRPDRNDELAALDLFERFADQEVTFTDCISFVLMRKGRIDTVFAFDRHFVLAGFKLWA